MSNILDQIVANTRKEVEHRKQLVSIANLESKEFFYRKPLALTEFLRDPNKSGIIAEIKKKSPSKGIINDKISVEEVAIGYESVGASAISVLTDFEYFGGKMEYLEAVRKKVNIPVLRKDFMVEDYQIIEAKAIGADVILLIAACLEPERLRSLARTAKSLGLSVLMEVHNLEELERSLCPELDVVGVNNRNLKNMEVSIQTSIALADKIPSEFLKISESGLKGGEEINELKKFGFEGFLIGESFMKTADPAAELKKFIQKIN